MATSRSEGGAPLAGRGGPEPTSSSPSAEELAAIVAAVELAWPRPVAAATERRPQGRWRFSGRRWWPGRFGHRRRAW
ncbi:MAG: hypothetical protein M3N68_04130 [Actinomycetota bacterium]|nr:hypothetical protein [Actinomycetota bacterium]